MKTLSEEEYLAQEIALKEKFYFLDEKNDSFEKVVTNGRNIEEADALALPKHGVIPVGAEDFDMTSIVKSSPYDKRSPNFDAIVKDFNSLGQESAPRSLFTIANQWFGWIFALFNMPFKRLEPGELRLVHKNNMPELSINTVDRQRLEMTFNPTDTCEELGVYKQTAPVIGNFGHFLINVPRGKYGKVMLGNEARLYGEGYHVIHDPNAKFEKGDNFTVAVNEPYINLSDIHVFNIPKGQLAKVRIGNDYQLLAEGHHHIREPRLVMEGFASSGEQYIEHGNVHRFNLAAGKMALTQSGGNYKILGNGIHFIEDANLKCGNYVTQTEPFVSHGNLHFLNVPKGEVALVLEDNIPKLLHGGRHVIKHSNFVVEEYVSITKPYIQHQDLHQVMIAPGNIALVSVENETRILVGRKEPYLFQSNNFSIMEKEDSYTFSQDSKHLCFNGLHYILPDQGEVPYLYDGGELLTLNQKSRLDESEEALHGTQEELAKAFMVNSPTARFGGFLDTRLQTLEFPSAEVEEERVEDYDMSRQDARFDSFKTRDGDNVGVRFMVTYRITDPEKSLKVLKSQDEIVRHIERVVNADMVAAIGLTPLNDIGSTGSHITSTAKMGSNTSLSRESEESWQEHVKAELKKDLADYGIELGRLNIEEWIVLDKDVRQQMAMQSKDLSGSRAEQSALMVKFETEQLRLSQEKAILAATKDNQQAKTDLALAQSKGEQDVDVQAAMNRATIAKIDLDAAELNAQAQILPSQKEAELLDNDNYRNMQMVKEASGAIRESRLFDAAQVGATANALSSFGATMNPSQGLYQRMYTEFSHANPDLTFFANDKAKQDSEVANQTIELSQSH